MCRDILKAFFFVLLALFSALTANFFLIRYRAFEPEIYKNYLVKSSFYVKFTEGLQTTLEKQQSTQGNENVFSAIFNQETQEVDPSPLLFQAVAKEALTPEPLQTVVESTIDDTFAYVKGETDKAPTTDFQKIFNDYEDKETLFKNVEDQVKELAASAPTCDSPGADPEQCIPADAFADIQNFDIAEYIKQAAAESGSGIKIEGTDFDFDNVKLEQPTEQDLKYNEPAGFVKVLKEAYTNSGTILLVGSIITAFLLLMIILLTRKEAPKLLNVFGWALMVMVVTSVLVAAVALFGIWTASQTLMLAGGYIPQELISVLKDTIIGLIFELQRPLYIIAALVAVMSILILIVSGLIGKDEKPKLEQQGEITIKKKLTESPPAKEESVAAEPISTSEVTK